MAERAYLGVGDRSSSCGFRPASSGPRGRVMEDLKIEPDSGARGAPSARPGASGRRDPATRTFVTEVHVGDVGRIYEFRASSRSSPPAGGRATPRGDLDEIEEMIAELPGSTRYRPPRWTRAPDHSDQRAHSLVYRLADNRLIEDALNSLLLPGRQDLVPRVGTGRDGGSVTGPDRALRGDQDRDARSPAARPRAQRGGGGGDQGGAVSSSLEEPGIGGRAGFGERPADRRRLY